MQEIFLQNGVLGAIVVALGYVVITLYKKQDERQRDLENDMRDLRKRFDEYMEEDRREMLQTIHENTEVCRELLAHVNGTEKQ